MIVVWLPVLLQYRHYLEHKLTSSNKQWDLPLNGSSAAIICSSWYEVVSTFCAVPETPSFARKLGTISDTLGIRLLSVRYSGPVRHLYVANTETVRIFVFGLLQAALVTWRRWPIVKQRCGGHFKFSCICKLSKNLEKQKNGLIWRNSRWAYFTFAHSHPFRIEPCFAVCCRLLRKVQFVSGGKIDVGDDEEAQVIYIGMCGRVTVLMALTGALPVRYSWDTHWRIAATRKRVILDNFNGTHRRTGSTVPHEILTARVGATGKRVIFDFGSKTSAHPHHSRLLAKIVIIKWQTSFGSVWWNWRQ